MFFLVLVKLLDSDPESRFKTQNPDPVRETYPDLVRETDPFPFYC